MHAALSTLAVATLVSVVSAQNGYGRFPCTKTVNGVRQAGESGTRAIRPRPIRSPRRKKTRRETASANIDFPTLCRPVGVSRE